MDDKDMMQAVVLSSHVVGLGVIRALGSMRVPVTAVSYQKHDMGRSSKYVKQWLQVPHPEKDENGFVYALMQNAEKWGRSILVPADDATLLAVSRNKELLSSVFVVACPDWTITEQIMDKANTYKLAESIGIPIPRTTVLDSSETLEKTLCEFRFPCIVKPCLSHLYADAFNKKLTKVETEDDMRAAYEEADNEGLTVMAQEYIPGEDSCGVHYNSYFCNGESVAHITAEKVRMSPPGSGVPRVVMSKDVPAILEPAERLLRALNFTGFSCTEFKRDPRDGKYKLLEVNGRHNRSGLLSLSCGVNFPWLEYEHLIRGETSECPVPREGVYWIDEFHDLIQSIRYLFVEHYMPGYYLRPYISPHTYAVLDKTDVQPFIRRCIDMPSIAFERLFKISRDLNSEEII